MEYYLTFKGKYIIQRQRLQRFYVLIIISKICNYYHHIILLFLLALVMIFPDVFKPIIDRFAKMELSDNGRFVLLREGIESFKLNPIFGIGFYYKHADIPHWFHNSVVQILASTGIFGSVLYGVFFYQRYAVPFKKFNTSNFL